jgi:hypothetical protein
MFRRTFLAIALCGLASTAAFAQSGPPTPEILKDRARPPNRAVYLSNWRASLPAAPAYRSTS